MKQTRLVSAIEAFLNVLSGFFISWGVMMFIVSPIFGYKAGAGEALLVTGIFTVTSIIRAYIIRRAFNNDLHKRAAQWLEHFLIEQFRLASRESKASSPK